MPQVDWFAIKKRSPVEVDLSDLKERPFKSFLICCDEDYSSCALFIKAESGNKPIEFKIINSGDKFTLTHGTPPNQTILGLYDNLQELVEDWHQKGRIDWSNRLPKARDIDINVSGRVFRYVRVTLPSPLMGCVQ